MVREGRTLITIKVDFALRTDKHRPGLPNQLLQQAVQPSTKGEDVSNPLSDKFEVSIDFPHKVYMGTFGRESRFEVTADREGMHLHLNRPGEERRHVGFHVHYYLLVDILSELAQAVGEVEGLDPTHRARLAEAADKLAAACKTAKP
jgi:hypothetical protein